MSKAYAAHLIFIFDRPATGRESPKRFLVEESVFLLFARSWDEANKKAKKVGLANELVDEKMTVGGVVVTMFFVGVRKVWELIEFPEVKSKSLKGNPVEIGFLKLVFKDRGSVRRYSKGGGYGPIIEVPKPPRIRTR